MFYPNNIEEKIDFVVIREELLRRCASVLGREQVEAMHMETDYETVQHMLLLTDQMRRMQSDPMLTFPRGEIHDLREEIARIRIEGLFLDEAELDALRKSLSYAVELERFFASLDEHKYPLVKNLSGEAGLSVKRSRSHLEAVFSEAVFRQSSERLTKYWTVTANWPTMLRLNWHISGANWRMRKAASAVRWLPSCGRQRRTDW